MSRASLLISVGVVGAGACSSQPARVAPLPSHVATLDAGTAPTPDASTAAPVYTGEWSPFPGCSETEATSRRAELDALAQRARGDAKGFGDAMAALLARPCLSHVAPAVKLVDGVDEVWSGLVEALVEATHGFTVKNGKRLLVIPPEPIKPLSPDVTKRLTELTCANPDKGCGRAESYILRAETAFDDALMPELIALRGGGTAKDRPGMLGDSHVEIPTTWCGNSGGQNIETFLAWVDCVARLAPRSLRFARRDLRAPETGWLVLRGRRGHYISQDEIRAYDLATGAAYIVSGDSGHSPPQVHETTGTVGIDHVRELAFMLLAREAVVSIRRHTVYAVVPDRLALELGPYEQGYGGGMVWSTTAQTDISFTFIGSIGRIGSFTWPHAQSPIDNHIVELLSVLEAGLVRGCAPAKLPASSKLFRADARIGGEDDDKSPMRAIYADLERRLDALRSQACPRAK